MWKLYDALLDNMDGTETMADFWIGPRWAAVQSSSGSAGVAPVIYEQRDRFDFSYLPVKGMSLKEMGIYLKSWNFLEASLALAAVNAYYNKPQESSSPDSSLSGSGRPAAAGSCSLSKQSRPNPADAHSLSEQIRSDVSDSLNHSGHSGGDVGDIPLSVTLTAGSDETFPPRRKLPGGRRVRKSFQTFCEEHTAEGMTILAEPLYDQDELSELPGRKKVLRQYPESGDYLYTAGQALIPEADRLILSGSTLVNKTAGPLYEHAIRSGVPVFLFGPEIPLCPALHQSGICGLWGLVIDQPEKLMQLARVQLSRDTLLRTGHFEVLEQKRGNP